VIGCEAYKVIVRLDGRFVERLGKWLDKRVVVRLAGERLGTSLSVKLELLGWITDIYYQLLSRGL
jgi:hypothetical protein